MPFTASDQNLTSPTSTTVKLTDIQVGLYQSLIKMVSIVKDPLLCSTKESSPETGMSLADIFHKVGLFLYGL